MSLPETSFLMTHSHEEGSREGDGRPNSADPAHLREIHRAVEDMLFCDGSPPHCNLVRPSQFLRRRLEGLTSLSYAKFETSFQPLLDILLYGKAVYQALSKPFDPGRILKEFGDVPAELRGTICGESTGEIGWSLKELYRKQLRACFYRVRAERVEPMSALVSADFRPKQIDDFARRASVFIVEDFERHHPGHSDFYELAALAVKAYTRWQCLLVVEAKLFTTPATRAAHMN